jgi:hypothetical protein
MKTLWTLLKISLELVSKFGEAAGYQVNTNIRIYTFPYLFVSLYQIVGK